MSPFLFLLNASATNDALFGDCLSKLVNLFTSCLFFGGGIQDDYASGRGPWGNAYPLLMYILTQKGQLPPARPEILHIRRYAGGSGRVGRDP